MPSALFLSGNAHDSLAIGGILKAFRLVAHGHELRTNVNFDEIGQTIKTCGSLSLLHLDFDDALSNVKWGLPPAVNTLESLAAQLADAVEEKINCVVVLTAFYSDDFAEQLHNHGFRNVVYVDGESSVSAVAQFCEGFYRLLAQEKKWRAAFAEAQQLLLSQTEGLLSPFMCIFGIPGPDFAPMRRLPFEPRLRGPPSVADAAPLLIPEYRVVNFVGHDSWLDEYEAWCLDEAEPRLAVRVLHGHGGSGKTRGMVELTERLRVKGVVAGFLCRGTPAEEFAKKVLNEDRRVVVVLDYAETWPKLNELLRAAAIRPKEASGHLRIVLLIRHASDWLLALKQAMDGLKLDVKVEQMQEPPDSPKKEMFDGALQAFAKALGKPVPVGLLAPSLTDTVNGHVLMVQLAALVTLLGHSFNTTTLMSVILDHEEQYWFCHRETKGWTTSNSDNFVETFAQLVAAVVLRGGSVSEEWATKVFERLGLTRMFGVLVDAGLQDGDFGSLLRRLYPPPPLSSQYVAPLEPDLVGEAMVVRVLSKIEFDEDLESYFQTVFHDGNEDALCAAESVLGRLNTDPSQVEQWRRAASLEKTNK